MSTESISITTESPSITTNSTLITTDSIFNADGSYLNGVISTTTDSVFNTDGSYLNGVITSAHIPYQQVSFSGHHYTLLDSDNHPHDMIQMIYDLQNQVMQLQQELAEIKEHVMYMPNGLGYQMAQQEFEQLQSQITPNDV